MRSRMILVPLSLVAMLALGVGTASARPPENHTPRNATEIFFATPVSQETFSATGHVKAPCANAGYMTHVVWFVYTAASTMQVDAGTYGSDYDTVLVIYEGNSKNRIACDDDSAGSGLSRYLLNVTAGVTYYFAVGSDDRSEGGNLTFDLGT